VLLAYHLAHRQQTVRLSLWRWSKSSDNLDHHTRSIHRIERAYQIDLLALSFEAHLARTTPHHIGTTGAKRKRLVLRH